jgi:hypothetical protein
MYAYEPGLIARLLGAVLEAAHAYGGKVTQGYCVNERTTFVYRCLYRCLPRMKAARIFNPLHVLAAACW